MQLEDMRGTESGSGGSIQLVHGCCKRARPAALILRLSPSLCGMVEACIILHFGCCHCKQLYSV